MPYCLELGMTPDQYWKGDPYLVQVYRKLKLSERENRNAEAWWQGYYFYQALDVIAFNLTREKGKQAENYPDKPLRITPLTEEEKRAKAQEERNKAIQFFKQKADEWSKANGRQ